MSAVDRRPTAGRIVGYDTSEDMRDLSVICAACADDEGDRRGSTLYAGDEWGGPLTRCEACRRAQAAQDLGRKR